MSDPSRTGALFAGLLVPTACRSEIVVGADQLVPLFIELMARTDAVEEPLAELANHMAQAMDLLLQGPSLLALGVRDGDLFVWSGPQWGEGAVVVPLAVSISVNTLSSTSPGSTTIWLPMVWFVGPGS